MFTGVAIIAFLTDRFFGYPDVVYQQIKHPVQWMGVLLDWLDKTLNRPRLDPMQKRLLGVAALAVLLIVTFVAARFVQFALHIGPLGWLLEGVVASSLLAQRHLAIAVRDVADALDRSLPEARLAVSHIVGRDTTRLDEPGVARAAVETLAENASDGVFAPLFYLLVFGLPGIALYKAINTADSMIGHLDEKYRNFGWAAARLDDVANFIPARATALLFAGAASFLPRMDARAAWDAARRDGPSHHSVNAGWPEAAMAGALGLKLGGPRAYEGEMLDLPEMGDGRSALDRRDIRRALWLFSAACWLSLSLLILLRVVGI